MKSYSLDYELTVKRFGCFNGAKSGDIHKISVRDVKKFNFWKKIQNCQFCIDDIGFFLPHYQSYWPISAICAPSPLRAADVFYGRPHRYCFSHVIQLKQINIFLSQNDCIYTNYRDRYCLVAFNSAQKNTKICLAKKCEYGGEKSKNANTLYSLIWHLRVVIIIPWI